MQSVHGESPEEASYHNRAPATLRIGHDFYSEDKFETSENSYDEEFDHDEDDWDTDDGSRRSQCER